MSKKSTNENKAQVLLWVPSVSVETERAGLPSFRGAAESVLQVVKVDTEIIANNLKSLVESLQSTLSISANTGDFALEEIELNLKVSATGELGFVASVSAGSEASITLRMKRKKSAEEPV